MAWTSCMVTFFLGIFLGLLTPGVKQQSFPSHGTCFGHRWSLQIFCDQRYLPRTEPCACPSFQGDRFHGIRSVELKLSNFSVGCTETKVTQGIYQKS